VCLYIAYCEESESILLFELLNAFEKNQNDIYTAVLVLV
jgi:hypothetical protein